MYTKHIQLKKLKNASSEKLMQIIYKELKQHKLSSIEYNHPYILFTPTFWLITPNWGKHLSPISSGSIQFDENESIIEISLSYKWLVVVCAAFSMFAIFGVLSSQQPSSGGPFLLFGLFVSWGVMFSGGRFFGMVRIKNAINKCINKSGYRAIS